MTVSINKKESTTIQEAIAYCESYAFKEDSNYTAVVDHPAWVVAQDLKKIIEKIEDARIKQTAKASAKIIIKKFK